MKTIIKIYNIYYNAFIKIIKHLKTGVTLYKEDITALNYFLMSEPEQISYIIKNLDNNEDGNLLARNISKMQREGLKEMEISVKGYKCKMRMG